MILECREIKSGCLGSFRERHRLMNFCVAATDGAVANIKSLPGSPAPSVVMC